MQFALSFEYACVCAPGLQVTRLEEDRVGPAGIAQTAQNAGAKAVIVVKNPNSRRMGLGHYPNITIPTLIVAKHRDMGWFKPGRHLSTEPGSIACTRAPQRGS